MWLVAYLATASRRAQVAITIVYRLYSEGRFPLPALQGHSPKSIVLPKLSTRDSFTR